MKREIASFTNVSIFTALAGSGCISLPGGIFCIFCGYKFHCPEEEELNKLIKMRKDEDHSNNTETQLLNHYYFYTLTMGN
jgi:hypothetical protein